MAKKNAPERGTRDWVLNECYELLTQYKNGLARDLQMKGSDAIKILELIVKLNAVTPESNEDEIKKIVSLSFRDNDED